MSYFVTVPCRICRRLFVFTAADPHKVCVSCFKAGAGR